MLIKLNRMKRIAYTTAITHEAGTDDGIVSPRYERSNRKHKLKELQHQLCAHCGPLNLTPELSGGAAVRLERVVRHRHNFSKMRYRSESDVALENA